MEGRILSPLRKVRMTRPTPPDKVGEQGERLEEPGFYNRNPIQGRGDGFLSG
ncbi:hypothetical protein NBRC3257_2861 [Gluconobacter thailandicus NBRC 3257]|uniref:Transposase n=1 Tax=Gluconobacter thailandicus NBRC 3257 TaxID=1381097 RepID=A0ABQ0J086_GLUTH|nr:hypothetical protein B932_2758 [Gluconobacter oxydans H24]GAC86676.1 hypothetical protein NBRC3255_0337 [Gluconobacter thailandicus NBRC 3255]GAD27862.1 hypothetical protein NBRC3257_2861 [Gluconobacter thailandicus NBRC 3257]